MIGVKLHVAYMFGGMNRGGAETIMLDLFQNHQHAPYPFIGIHRKGGSYHDAFYNAGPELYQLAPKRFGYVRYLLQLRKLLKNKNITVVHTQHWLDCIYAWLATIGLSIRIVNTFHGFYSMKGIAGWLCRMSIRMADDVCFVSKYEQEWYQKQMKIADEKCHTIYNGVDFGKIETQSEQITLPETKVPHLAMVGSFNAARCQLLVCKALHVLQQEVEFYFIGAKNENLSDCYQQCYDYCQTNNMLSRVKFEGEQSNVYAWLKEMDGFVYATKHDTFGIALVEALAIGLPAVVSDWNVMKEICEPFKESSVQLFDLKDENDCADKIKKLINQLEKYKQEAEKNEVKVKELYSLEAYFTRLNKIYTQYDNQRKVY